MVLLLTILFFLLLGSLSKLSSSYDCFGVKTSCLIALFVGAVVWLLTVHLVK